MVTLTSLRAVTRNSSRTNSLERFLVSMMASISILSNSNSVSIAEIGRRVGNQEIPVLKATLDLNLRSERVSDSYISLRGQTIDDNKHGILPDGRGWNGQRGP